MSEHEPEEVLLSWPCDKEDCEHLNKRWVPKGTIINIDKCDCCERNIHEPLTELVTTNKREDA
jgi:hypothetical protein